MLGRVQRRDKLNTNSLVQSHRPVVMGSNGMVTSAHPLASTAGLRTLMEGGNAFDAVVATAATLNVVEPYMSGMGGVGCLLAYVAAENRTRVLNFTGRAPGAAESSLFTDENKERGILSILVPGNVAGWLTLHETYGRLDPEDLFKYAIEYAEDGFPLTYLNHFLISDARTRWSPYSSSRAIMERHGELPGPGEKLKQPQLAQSLRKVAKEGKEVFYRGELAHRIVEECQRMGGLLKEEDLADYEAWWEDPIGIDYRGYQVLAPPPNSDGFQMLETLKILESYLPDELSHGAADTLHRMMEATKLAITDRIKYAGDPNHASIPLRGLLSSQYAAGQRARINMEKAAAVQGEHYNPQAAEHALLPGKMDPALMGSTTHMAVADREGNVVTLTQSLGSGFGSGIAIGDTGIFLNNVANWFDLAPAGESPNIIGPRRLVEWCPTPAHVLKNGKLFLSIGTPGGYGIAQTTAQMLMHVLDYDMTVQQAIEAPRFKITAGRSVEMEERFSPEVRAKLAHRGHQIDVVEPWSRGVGGAQGIMVDQKAGSFSGGADPRRDGYAMGW